MCSLFCNSNIWKGRVLLILIRVFFWALNFPFLPFVTQTLQHVLVEITQQVVTKCISNSVEISINWQFNHPKAKPTQPAHKKGRYSPQAKTHPSTEFLVLKGSFTSDAETTFRISKNKLWSELANRLSATRRSSLTVSSRTAGSKGGTPCAQRGQAKNKIAEVWVPSVYICVKYLHFEWET